MKKMMKLITLNIVAVSMTTTMFAIEFVDQAAADAFAKRQQEESQRINENMEKGKTDDTALKEAICSLFGMITLLTDFDPVTYVVEDMHRLGIPRERQIQGLENITRGMLSAVEKDEKNDDTYWVLEFIAMLGTFSDYDILPLLRECLDSKNEVIRNGAMKRYNIIMENLPNQPQPTNGITQKDETGKASDNVVTNLFLPVITGTPIPAITDEMEQLRQETPQQKTEETSSNKTTLWVTVITFLAILGVVTAWKKNPKRKLMK